MKNCFNCKQVISTITDEFIGDVRCGNCKVMNSFYDPADLLPQPDLLPEGEENAN